MHLMLTIILRLCPSPSAQNPILFSLLFLDFLILLDKFHRFFGHLINGYAAIAR